MAGVGPNTHHAVIFVLVSLYLSIYLSIIISFVRPTRSLVIYVALMRLLQGGSWRKK
jgi:hypothetical protein